MSVFLVPYSMKSEGAKLLAQAMGIKRINANKTTVRQDHTHTVLWWGARRPLPFKPGQSYNGNSRLVIDKMSFFKHCEGQPWSVPFTTSKEKAREWLVLGSKVLGRTTLTGSGGEGIIVYRTVQDFDTCTSIDQVKVFVKYIPKGAEYRIHVVRNKVIDRARKVRSSSTPLGAQGWEVRSHDNGFVFQKNNFTVPACVDEAAVAAMIHCGIDYGGVDVIYNMISDKAYVLEINSAPGIEGSTVTKYAGALKEMIDVLEN